MMRLVIGVVLAVLYSMIQIPAVHALEISVAPGFMYYTWEEHVSGGNVKESGYLPTITGSIADMPLREYAPEWRLQLDTNGFYGQVDYDTRTQSGIPAKTDSSYWGFKFGGSTGLRMMVSDQSYVEPFIGLVYSLWERDIESVNVPPIGAVQGYPEFYQVLHGRVGIQTGLSPKVDRIIHFSFSMDPMLWSREQVDYPGVGRIVIQNGRRLGWTIEGGILWWHLDTKVYWRAVRFGASNVASGLFQPKSDQDMVGLQIGYRF